MSIALTTKKQKSPRIVCIKCGYYNKKKILSVTTSYTPMVVFIMEIQKR